MTPQAEVKHAAISLDEARSFLESAVERMGPGPAHAALIAALERTRKARSLLDPLVTQ